MRTKFLCVSVLRVASGPRVKLASCKSALNPSVVCSFDRSKAVVPVLVVCLSVCHFVHVFFSPFSIAITSLGEERANLSAFRTFVRFVLVWICRFPLPLGVWEGLRFVIVALPGLFPYLFFLKRYIPAFRKEERNFSEDNAFIYAEQPGSQMINFVMLFPQISRMNLWLTLL